MVSERCLCLNVADLRPAVGSCHLIRDLRLTPQDTYHEKKA